MSKFEINIGLLKACKPYVKRCAIISSIQDYYVLIRSINMNLLRNCLQQREGIQY